LKQLVHCYYSQGKLDEAVGFCDELVFEAKERKDTQGIVESIFIMGNIYLAKKQYDLAQKFYEQSIKMIDTTSEKPQITIDKGNKLRSSFLREIVKALNNVGFTLQWKNLHQPAAKFYELAIMSINKAEEQKIEGVKQLRAHVLTNLGIDVVEMMLKHERGGTVSYEGVEAGGGDVGGSDKIV
jgi:tetratricopeptide (TPR) repeat protein